MYVYNNPNYNEVINDFKACGLNVMSNRIFIFANPLEIVNLYYDLVNPFERIATALYVASGCSEYSFLENYTEHTTPYQHQLNAPIGERIRCFNKNSYQNFVFNPIDQLVDAYEKLKNGKDAVIQIYNTTFDNNSFAQSDEKGVEPKDLTLSLEVNNGYLNATLLSSEANILDVFSNTLESYTVIMRLLSCWLGVEVGVYTHIVLKLYCNNVTNVKEYKFEGLSPAFNTSMTDFNDFVFIMFNKVIDSLHDDNFILSRKAIELLEVLKTIPDDYLRDIAISMFSYRCFKLGEFDKLFESLKCLSYTLSVECLHFLFEACKNCNGFKDIYKDFIDSDIRYIEHRTQRHY